MAESHHCTPQNQELVTEGEVCRVSRESDQVPPLQDKLADLQAEVNNVIVWGCSIAHALTWYT